MATIPFPFGTDKVTGARLPRVSFPTMPVTPDYSQRDMQHLLAEMGRAFNTLDDAVTQIERRLRAIEEVVFP